MKLSTYLSVGGIVAMLFGLAFLLVPEYAGKQYGVPTEPHNLMQARYFGATLLPYGLILWLARDTHDDTALRAILQSAVVINVLGAGISVWAGLAGLQNAMVWGSVAIYALLLLGAVYFLAYRARQA